tara:strand:- start:156 stop:644 length:489 start_codon:yes stop_codon:yes gene_type:complete
MATRWDNLPGLNDDVAERSVEDYKKMKKGQNADSSKVKGTAREVIKEAGARGRNRLVGRAGYAGAALQGGYELGRELDERTGAGKKMVKGSNALKAVANKIADSDRVQLSEDSKNRMADMENDKTLREVDAEKDGMKKGGHVKSYVRGGGIEQRGKTRGKMC